MPYVGLRPRTLEQDVIDREEEVLSGSGRQSDAVRGLEERVPVGELVNSVDLDRFVRIIAPDPRCAERDTSGLVPASFLGSGGIFVHQVIPGHHEATVISIDSPPVELVDGDATARNGRRVDLWPRIFAAYYRQTSRREGNDPSKDRTVAEVFLGHHRDVVKNNAAGPCLFQETARLGRV
jgi:hypothetical protein